MSDYDDAYDPAPVATTSPGLLMERHVLGAIIQSPHVLRSVKQQIVPRDFEDLRHGAIYGGMVRMDADGEPISYLTVWEKLTSWDVRGIDLLELSRWADDVADSSTAGYYAGRVREASVKRAAAAVGVQLQNAGGEVGVTVAKSIEALRTLQQLDGAGTDGVRWLADVLDVPEDEDAYDWVIPDLLERQDRLMLSAAEGTGKSVFLRQIALLAAGGIHPFRFSPIPPIRALVVDAENSERQLRRSVRSLAAEVELRGQRNPMHSLALHCTPVMDLASPNDLGRIHRWIDEAKPDLLVLGPLYRMTKGSLNNDDDVDPVLAALDSIRERNVSMLIEVHAGHARSSSGERELRPRGSSALLGWPEFGMGLRKRKGDQGRQTVFDLARWRGDREQREWPRYLVKGQIWPWEPTVIG